MEEEHSNGLVPVANTAQWATAEAVLGQILAQDTALEHTALNWQLIAFGCMLVTLASLGFAYIGWFTRPEYVPYVQLVQVDEQKRVQMVGEPLRVEAYAPQDGEWQTMLGRWVLYLRWRGRDKPQAQHAWKWLDLHTCGIGRQQLQRYIEVEKPMEQLGVKKRQLELKNIFRSDMPHAWTILWHELEVDGPMATQERQQSGTFTIGRRKVEGSDMRLYNPLGLCVSGFNLGVQS